MEYKDNISVESIESFKREPDYIYEGEFSLHFGDEEVDVHMWEGELGCVLFAELIQFSDVSWYGRVGGVGITKDIDNVGREDQEKFRELVKLCDEKLPLYSFTVSEDKVLFWFK